MKKKDFAAESNSEDLKKDVGEGSISKLDNSLPRTWVFH